MMSIYFICVNFNNSDYTKKLIESLLAQSGIGSNFSVRCVVVDNSTSSFDSSTLKDYCGKFSWVRLIDQPENPGYFGGLNIGLDSIDDGEKEKIVVVGNNDLEYDSEFCQILMRKYISYPQNVHALAPDVVTLDKRHQNPHIPTKISAWRRLQFDFYYSHYCMAVFLLFVKSTALSRFIPMRQLSNHLSAREIHMGVGACYVLLPAFFEHSSSLDCPIFLYGEEAFFSHQIHQNGGILYFDPDMLVHHAESASLSRLPKRKTYEYARSGYHLYRNLM
jgi:GT2 family glycosyltransferase